MKIRNVLFGVFVLLSPQLAQAQLADCSCKDFDKLQQELENAVTLRDRHQAKADEMERRLKNGESRKTISQEYDDWEKDTLNGAGRGIIATTKSSDAAITYVPHGAAIDFMDQAHNWTSPVTKQGYTTDEYDAKKAHELEEKYRRENKKDLCDFSDPEKVHKGAEETSFCKDMRDILIAHEQHHQATCKSIGFIAFWIRTPVEVARDEVSAYNQQIAALEKEMAKALKGAAVQFELSSKLTYSAQMVSFQYTHTTSTTPGEIPDNDGKTWSVKLKGTHKTTADKISIAGMACTMSPISRDVDMTVDASQKNATIRFNSFGPAAGAAMKCARGGGMGSAMGTEPGGQDVTMPLKLSSTHTEDASKGKVAEMLKGKMNVSGQSVAKLSIICPKK